MLPPALVAKIRRIQFHAGHLVNDALSGEYASVFKGQGMEFDEVREYVPGDDVRSIDWNVTARMSQPFVKVFREEREMTMLLLVDVSPSQEFGSDSRNKQEVAAELAAVLAFLATRNNDKVGLVLFSDHVESYIPAKKGRGHVWRIIKEVLTCEGRGQATAISRPLELLATIQKRRASVFLISDFVAEAGSYERALVNVAKRHNVVCIHVEDPVEQDIPDVGLVDITDPETGRSVTVPSQSSTFRTWFSEMRRTALSEHQDLWRRLKVGTFGVSTQGDTIAPLEAFLRRREKGLR